MAYYIGSDMTSETKKTIVFEFAGTELKQKNLHGLKSKNTIIAGNKT